MLADLGGDDYPLPQQRIVRAFDTVTQAIEVLSMKLIPMLVVAAIVSASPLAAQEPTCKEVATRVASGESVEGDLAVLGRCTQARARALAGAVRRAAAESNTARLRDVMFAAGLTVDAEIHDALRSVTASGSLPARAYALCALAAHELSAPTVTFLRPGASEGGYSCMSLDQEKRRQAQDRPLPPDHRRAAHLMAREMLENPGTPRELRPVAQFLAVASAAGETREPEALPPTEPGKIQFAYDCGNRFWIRNGNSTPIQVTYEVEGTLERATIRVPGAVRENYGEFGLGTRAKGTVRFLFNGAVVHVEANAGRPCGQ